MVALNEVTFALKRVMSLACALHSTHAVTRKASPFCLQTPLKALNTESFETPVSGTWRSREERCLATRKRTDVNPTLRHYWAVLRET